MTDLHGVLDILMFATLIVAILCGYPVAFTLAGVALVFAVIGLAFGVFSPAYLAAFPQRIYGSMTNATLTAVPLFILMGVILERSKIAEDLLSTMADLFGRARGGLLYATAIVGALLAASTGVVGATVVTMGLLALPVMLRRGYAPSLAAGSIAAAGTLGQIIPPSVVLILLGDVLGSANQKAQLQMGVTSPSVVSVGDLFAGALIPGLLLVGLYLAYQAVTAWLHPTAAPAGEAGVPGWGRLARALAAPLILIVAVLGSILFGVATPTEGAAVGAAGAAFLAALRMEHDAGRGAGAPARIALGGAGALGLLAALRVATDLPVLFAGEGPLALAVSLIGAALALLSAGGLVMAFWILARAQQLRPALRSTVDITAMVFVILIGAALFTLVFRGLGGDEWVASMLQATPGGLTGAMIAVMLVMFVLGFFLDFIEICFVVAPLVAVPLIMMGADPLWLGVMMAINLQTSFLTPPFGFALFYLRGVAPPQVRTIDIYKGVVPFIALQLIALLLVAAFPALATWLPGLLYG